MVGKKRVNPIGTGMNEFVNLVSGEIVKKEILWTKAGLHEPNGGFWSSG